MKNENGTEGVVELWGQIFKRAENGLDENQIIPFVDTLINERDSLLQRQEHLSSLSMLAERTIAEADDVASKIKADAESKAKTEAEAIISKAQEESQHLIEEKKNEAISLAEKEAATIRTNTKKEVELIREKETEKIHSELKSTSQLLYGELLSQLENLVKQVKELEINFEQEISNSKQNTPIALDDENTDFSLDADWDFNTEISDTQPEDKVDQIDSDENEEEQALSDESNTIPGYLGIIELEIMPPIEMRKVMEIISYLDSMPEVISTELIPLADRPIIKVSLKESVNLIDVLNGLPEISQAIESTEDAEEDERKIQVSLSEISPIGETNNKFTDEILNILSQN